MMIPGLTSEKSKELDKILKQQKDCKEEFEATTQRVNGYLKDKIKGCGKSIRFKSRD